MEPIVGPVCRVGIKTTIRRPLEHFASRAAYMLGRVTVVGGGQVWQNP